MTTTPSKWARFKAWFKSHLPGWIKGLIQQVIDWLIPFLLQHGFSALVTEKAKVAYRSKGPDPAPPTDG